MGAKTLFIAAGHGGKDKGNTAVPPYVEADETQKITDQMYVWSTLNGVKRGLGGIVFLDDVLDLLGQVQAMNAWKANSKDGDLGVDIHLDYRRGGRGALVLHDETAQSQQVGLAFLRRWCNQTGIPNNGMHPSKKFAQENRGFDDFGWCRPREWGGIIVELGCLNSPPDMAIVTNPTYQHLVMQFLWEAFNEAG